ncbi:SDR family NAD(P)-dependent oxidoreductase [Lentzea sp. NPDC051213]|uniref:SDR family NAD(P)-dependent oxidoreductase n=1 Tax=Lentzea sp. NPDC051213 TaxID=3364126 RepID=UPI0037B12390
MDAREILTRVGSGELDLAAASAQLRGLGESVAGERETGEPAAGERERGEPDLAAPNEPAVGHREPIAVIGLSARFPGAENADEFWNLLLDGTDLVTEVPADRWTGFYDPDPAAAGATVSKWGAFIEDATAFDADFFRMTPREAELTDPQARLFLQESWRALQNAGLRPEALSGARCGVYAGVMLNDYLNRIERDSEHSRLPQVMQGNSNSMLAARLAYELDLRGPTATVDTACSSSLVALHLACQSLWLGEADFMIAGGVTLYLTELPYVFMSGAGMLSPTGRERAFDAGADGIVPGEGCAVVVLKPLSRALADGDPVHAVIRASGINSDGRTNGITAPSGRSQAALISETYQRFGVSPAGIDYVECHGTGTPLGDPIEVGALNEVFGPAGLPAGSVPIGSVKTNVGHTSAAAGLAGLVKAIGVVNSGEVPPTLHQSSANPAVPFAEGPFTVAARRTTLAPVDRPRRATVSAFGFSGTNAHVVVEQAPLRSPSVVDGSVVITLSARRPEGLASARRELRRWLAGPGAQASVADVAHTLAVARTHYEHRAAFVVRDRAALLVALAGEAPLSGPPLMVGLAEAYLRGEDVDWAEVYPAGRYRRLALPGYPFAKDRHDVVQVRSDAVPVRSDVTPVQPGVVPVRSDIELLDLWRPVRSASAVAAGGVVVRFDEPSHQAVIAGFESVRSALAEGSAVVAQAEGALAAAVESFVRSVRQENPRASISTPGRTVAEPIELSSVEGPAFRQGGVYLITGGMGGIGLALAHRLVERFGAKVVLCGRTPRESPGGGIRYVQTDVADAAAVAALVQDIVATEGALHGVLHAAGVVRDAFLARKQTADLAAVLAPKVDGVRALDAATADLPLELFVLFSSVAALTGNMGQTDYAFGNGYLDGFAVERAGRVAEGSRSGRTLSVEWPLWDGGGMSVPEPIRVVVEQQIGMVPLPVSLGLDALERLLAAPEPETGAVVSVFHGDKAKWREHLREHGLIAEPKPVAVPEVAQLVFGAFAAALGRQPHEFGLSTTIESLGLDSLMIRTLVAQLSRDVAPLGPELIYGVRDLGELVEHLTAALPVQEVPRLEKPREVPQNSDGFAIVGLAGRYPGAPDLDAFWRNLVGSVDTVADLPADRFSGTPAARGHFLAGIDRFDPEFFGLSEHDAALIDPQERLFLEVAWEALEDAGYAGDRLDELVAPDGQRRGVGVFVGVTSSDYQLLGAEEWARGSRTMPTGHYWSLANRVSYLFDLHGPSQPVDTACSSSLVALHQACESIRRGECAAALVGGVNLYLHPSRFRMLRQSGFLAEDGRCRSFGAGGAGFGPGEGAGAVLVKPLADAIAAGDIIHGVVLGSAVSHGGRTNGYTAPSPFAQARVLRQALRNADVDPATVTVLEAHGTGTELGDPVELAGLVQTYGGGPRCSLGSVKSAIGHGESAAGIAALTKVLLQLRYRTVAPTLHADPVNPNLDLAPTRFALQHEPAAWESDGAPRRAGISSFGAGGVNAHVIIEEYPQQEIARSSGPQLFLVSGPTPEHARATAQRIAEWVRHENVDLAAVAATLRTGRAAGPCRIAVVASSRAELAERLTAAEVSEVRGEHALVGVPETQEFVERLWHNGRLEQIGRLWLDGLSLNGERAHRIVPVPPSALLGRPLWFTGRELVVDEPTPVVVEQETVPDTSVLDRLVALAEPKAVGGTGPFDRERALPELGVDSINLMNLRFEIEEQFGMSIPLAELAERPLTELADHITAHRG